MESITIGPSMFLMDCESLLFQYAEMMNDTLIFAELLLTIAALTVRQEFCVTVEENGGIDHIYKGMVCCIETKRKLVLKQIVTSSLGSPLIKSRKSTPTQYVYKRRR